VGAGVDDQEAATRRNEPVRLDRLVRRRDALEDLAVPLFRLSGELGQQLPDGGIGGTGLAYVRL
jgi:hypothetical protein